MSDLTEFQAKVGDWGQKTFPKSTPLTIADHLLDEVIELREAVISDGYDSETIVQELADVFLLTLHLAHRVGADLETFALAKFEVNKRRKWQTEINERGYFSHVEPS